MEIKFYGQACFSIEDKDASLLMDPFDASIGLKPPSLKVDVVTVSHNTPAYNNVKAVAGEPRVFSWPGEYETKGVHFKIIHSFHNAEKDEEQLENNITVIHFNGIKFCHLGAQGRMLTEEQMEKIGDVDILFVPVGGKTVLGPKEAKKVVEQMEPRLIIPMVYATEGNKEELGAVAAFLAEMGSMATEPQPSFKVKKSEMPEDNSKVIVLNPII